jgi:4-hydroxyphenylpyruvate dioxygenase
MGPFLHDAPPATISAHNPAGTDGFEFVEFAHPEPAKLEALFARMSYVEVARHKTRDISLYRQGDINYIVNREPGTHAARFVAAHGPALRPWRGGSSMRGTRSSARSISAPPSTTAPTRRSTHLL